MTEAQWQALLELLQAQNMERGRELAAWQATVEATLSGVQMLATSVAENWQIAQVERAQMWTETLALLRQEREQEQARDRQWLESLLVPRTSTANVLSPPVEPPAPDMSTASRSSSAADQLRAAAQANSALRDALRGKTPSLDVVLAMLPPGVTISRATLGRLRAKIQAGEWDQYW